MPIGDVYKTTIFELAKWRNSLGYALPNEVITRAPSAELAEGQKDENSLPPYPILDAILKQLVDENKLVSEIYDFDAKLVERVENLVKRSAFKRAQMAKPIKV